MNVVILTILYNYCSHQSYPSGRADLTRGRPLYLYSENVENRYYERLITGIRSNQGKFEYTHKHSLDVRNACH